ncbi:unnamed protein product [Allacma fusca]|uniref:Protein sleepless n=1 Tax=Allacma fusca TaxID=39272 RepID=A0A8J2PMI6_9HEXA|nr:unnamed protein product [Allacma fusca]
MALSKIFALALLASNLQLSFALLCYTCVYYDGAGDESCERNPVDDLMVTYPSLWPAKNLRSSNERETRERTVAHADINDGYLLSLNEEAFWYPYCFTLTAKINDKKYFQRGIVQGNQNNLDGTCSNGTNSDVVPKMAGDPSLCLCNWDGCNNEGCKLMGTITAVIVALCSIVNFYM